MISKALKKLSRVGPGAFLHSKHGPHCNGRLVRVSSYCFQSHYWHAFDMLKSTGKYIKWQGWGWMLRKTAHANAKCKVQKCKKCKMQKTCLTGELLSRSLNNKLVALGFGKVLSFTNPPFSEYAVRRITLWTEHVT